MISINLNNKENLKLTPIFVKNRIPYIRNENNGCITIALPEKRIPQYKILNKSAVEFSNLIEWLSVLLGLKILFSFGLWSSFYSLFGQGLERVV